MTTHTHTHKIREQDVKEEENRDEEKDKEGDEEKDKEGDEEKDEEEDAEHKTQMILQQVHKNRITCNSNIHNNSVIS